MKMQNDFIKMPYVILGKQQLEAHVNYELFHNVQS